MKVLKFGGKSLAGGAPINNVIDIIFREQKDGDVAVVVSAMGASTDQLFVLIEV